MKKIVLTFIAMVSCGTMMAQDNKDAERRAPRMMTPEQMTERMTKELDLNKDQQEKVLDLNKEYQDVIGHPGMRRGPRGPRPEGMKKPDDMKKADGETGATQRPQRAARPELTDAQKEEMKKRMDRRKEYDEKLKTILTPEQLEKQQQHRRPQGPRR